ncbi:MAG: DNA repair protein RadA, partial [Longimicrobiales bacterium]
VKGRGRSRARGSGPALRADPPPVRLGDVDGPQSSRWRSGSAELDFVLGGGLVPGSMVLVGGEPGIGKSTLLLQLAAHLQVAGLRALYVSGEESAAQVRLRADRLGQGAIDVAFLPATGLEAIVAAADELRPNVLVIDSIQTTYSETLEATPGSVLQVRECAARLQRYAKETGTTVVLVGHVTKEGSVAGPRTLEHIVDTVLYFEAAKGLDHRLLRATKNRFGAADEIGVFRMSAAGLLPVANPSELFLRERPDAVSGTAVAATLEGTRPLLVEVQALCTRSSYGAPQRAATGFDRQRLALLLAVLEKRAGLRFAETDVFLNVVGGVRLTETAADLAVIVALASSMSDREIPAATAFVGEVGLGGELRAVGQMERRLAEAARMRFARVYAPAPAPVPQNGVEVTPLRDVHALLAALFGP